MTQRRGGRTPILGITLLELLMTMSLIAILLSIGAPALADLVARNRMATSVNGLLAHLQLARAEAVKRGARVHVCPSADGATCTGGRDWHPGYIVTLNGTEPAGLLRQASGISPAAIRITGNRDLVTYQPDGTSGGTNMTFLLCDQRPQAVVTDQRQVIVSNVGRPRTQIPEGQDPCRN